MKFIRQLFIAVLLVNSLYADVTFSETNKLVYLPENTEVVGVFTATGGDNLDPLVYTTNASSLYFDLNSSTGELKIIKDTAKNYEGNEPNDYNITITATQSGSGASDTLNLRIIITDVDEDPIVDSEPITKVYEDRMYNYLLVGHDEDPTDEVNWTTNGANPLPSWLTLTEGGNYVRRFAGLAPFAGEDSNASYAQLWYPRGIEKDSFGNIYFADSNNYVIRKIDTNGMITTFAGIPGYRGYSGDGDASYFAQIDYPRDIKIDSDGNFFIAESNRIRKIATDGVISTFATLPSTVLGLHIDEYDNIFATVGDWNTYKIDRNKNVEVVAGKGVASRSASDYWFTNTYKTSYYMNVYEEDELNATDAQFYYPQDSTTDSQGNIYISDMYNHIIRKIDTNGTISIFAGNYVDGRIDTNDSSEYDWHDDNSYYGYDVSQNGGDATEAKLNYPKYLTFDSKGNLMFYDSSSTSDYYGGYLRIIDTNGTIDTIMQISNSQGILNLEIDEDDNIYYSTYDHYIKKLSYDSESSSYDTANIEIIAGKGSNQGVDTTEGVATYTKLSSPNGIVTDSQRNVYVTSSNIIHKITPAGYITRFATSTSGTVNKITVGPNDSIYYTTSSYRVERADQDGTVTILANTSGTRLEGDNDLEVTQIGTTSSAYNGDGGDALDAKFYELQGIAVDDSGIIYVADAGANRVRKIALDRTITTFAGTGLNIWELGTCSNSYWYNCRSAVYTGEDGNATDATLSYPKDLALDSHGNLLIQDNGRIRKVDTDGIITTLKYLRYSTPTDIASRNGFGLDKNDNIFVTDSYRLYKYTILDGTYTESIIAGDGTNGYYNDNGLALEARFNYLYDIAIDDKDTMYVIDRSNGVVRKMFISSALVGIPRNEDLNGNVIENYNISVDLTDGDSVTTHSFTLAVHNTNDVPTSKDQNKTLLEDTSITLSSSDIYFEDIDPTGDTLQKIRIKNLPTKGTLYLDVNSNNTVDENETVVYNTELVAAQMNYLKYIPNANVFGEGIDNFSFIINDGMVYGYEYTITFNITGVDDAPIASSMAATVGPTSVNTFANFMPSFIDYDGIYYPGMPFHDANGNYPIMLKIETLPTIGTFEKTEDNGTTWTTITEDELPLIISMMDLTKYRFNAGTETGVNTEVNWSIMTSYDGTYENGLWSNTATGIVTVIADEDNNAPDVNITMNGEDINGTIVEIDEDTSTSTIYINFSDDYTPAQFINGIVMSSDETFVSMNDGDIVVNRIADDNVSVVITPKANVYGDVNITLGGSDGAKIGTKTFTLRIKSVDDAPVLENFDPIETSENGSSNIIDLNGTVSDIDSLVSTVTYSAKSSDESIAIVKIVDGKLVIIPQKDADGVVMIELSATLGGQTIKKSFSYIIENVNNAPTIESIDDMNLEQSTEIQTGSFIFSISDDVNVTSLNLTDSSTNDFTVSIEKVDETTGKITYIIPANASGKASLTVEASDGELSYKETFILAVEASNDALCVENVNTSLSFDDFKGENTLSNHIHSDLELIEAISRICAANIIWESSDTSVIENNGSVTIGTTNQTVSLSATIIKGDYNTTKEFLITVPKGTITDAEAVEAITFAMIKNKNLRSDSILSLLDLVDFSLGKTIEWSSTNNAIIDSYTGVVTRDTIDTNVTINATIGSESKEFNLTVVALPSNDSAKILKDKEWLTYAQLLDKNKDNDNVIYDLIKPLPTIAPNGSTISWNSSNVNVITIEGDVSRDSLVDKYIRLTATITLGSESLTKEFSFRVIKNSITEKVNTTFKKVDENSSSVSVVFDSETQSDISTTANFNTNIQNKLTKEVVDNSVKGTIELVDVTLNLYLNTDGTTQSQTERFDENNNSVISSIKVDIPKSISNVDENGSVETIVDIDANTSLVAELLSDGSVQHMVNTENQTKTSTVTAKLPGSKVVISNDGNLTSTSEIIKDGYIIKAIAVTDTSGETRTKFIRISILTGEQSELEPTLNNDTPYEAGNKVEISDINGTVYIKTNAPLGDNELIVE